MTHYMENEEKEHPLKTLMKKVANAMKNRRRRPRPDTSIQPIEDPNQEEIFDTDDNM